MDSYIDIEDPNSKDAKWQKDLAETILRVFETLYKDEDSVF